MVSSLMNALEGECLCLREISINVNKLLAVLLLRVYLFICFFTYCILLLPVYFLIPFVYTDVVVACLLLYPIFYTDIVAIFFVHSLIMYTSLLFLFLKLLFTIFKNTISIFVIIYKKKNIILPRVYKMYRCNTYFHFLFVQYDTHTFIVYFKGYSPLNLPNLWQCAKTENKTFFIRDFLNRLYTVFYK